jgi:lipopolysaccharide cholinephosphotransferase
MNYFDIENGFGESKQLAIDLLKETIDILNEFGVNHFLISGTLLGYVRHNDFIPWDDDIDLLVEDTIYDKMEQIVTKYPNINLFFKDKRDAVKICYNDGKPVSPNSDWNGCAILNQSKKYTWPYIDLFTYTSGPGLHACGDWKIIDIGNKRQKIFLAFNGRCDSNFRFIKDDLIVFFHNNWKKKDFFPVKKVNFLGIECNIPNNYEVFLRKNYGINYMTIVEAGEVIHKSETIITNKIKVNLNDIRR